MSFSISSLLISTQPEQQLERQQTGGVAATVPVAATAPLASTAPLPAVRTIKPTSTPRVARQPAGPISCMNCKTTTTPLWRRDPTTGAHLCNRCGLYLKAYNTMHPLKKTIKKRSSPPANRDGSSCSGSCCSPSQSSSTETESAGTCPGNGQCDGTGGSSSCAGCPAYNQKQLSQDGHAVKRKRVSPKQQMQQGLTPTCYNCGVDYTPLWRRDPDGNVICNACGLYYKLHNKIRPVTMKRAVIKRRNRTTPQHSRIERSPSIDSDATVCESPTLCGLESLAMAVELASDSSSSSKSSISASSTSSTSSASSASSASSQTQDDDGDSVMLDSLASVASLESKQQAESYKDELQRECERLRQLLARSTALLNTL
ncbi:glucocorticoid receptor-like (DNA-binding domain) [Linderina pennispora]|uniref:Glucocorticoid receptor-like (DNA-binding domain) n=1 Tax=Linderina pennispora TaxID=61395 RepID=A0A1Y1VVM0_9FUNG|nr:glucocorticoid receptor-like (DNA-binding domain) [Linderina pennispora]ORX65243.1 glucocorticoid receptor-like (DNA-binding domain) [Linderina pennispora]